MAGNGGVGRSAFSVHLPYDESAAARARAAVSEFLAGRPRLGSELIADALLVVHELVINGLVHGAPDERGGIEVSGAIADHELLISVRDLGTRGTVAPRPFTVDRPSGRGLAMVAAVSSRWSVDRSSGTRVSAWLRL